MVTYTYTLKEEQPQQWHMIDSSGHDYGPGQYPQLSVAVGDTGTFAFTITQGANFAASPIGVVGGANKPPHAGVGNGQINVTVQTPTSLTFTDSNNLKGHNQLNYVLYFSDGPNSTLDPIISNGGCCTAPGGGGTEVSQIDAAIIIAALAVVLLLIYFAYRKTSAKRRGAGATPGSTPKADDVSRDG